MTTLLRVTALVSRSGPTISNTKVWRAGMSKAFTMPRVRAKANTIQSSITPVSTRTPSEAASSPDTAWVTNRKRRLSTRSATTPPMRAEHEHRQELEGDHQAEPGATAGELQHQPAEGDALHPRAADRDDLAEEVEAVVVRPESPEGLAGRALDPGHGRGSVGSSESMSRSSTGRAAARRARSSSSRRASRSASQALRSSRMRAALVGPCGDLHGRDPPIGRIGRALDPPLRLRARPRCG